MYISDFELENLRCFEGTHTVSLARPDGSFAGWTVFAGRNATGKTSLLQALVLGYVDIRRSLQLQNLLPRMARTDRAPRAEGLTTWARAYLTKSTGENERRVLFAARLEDGSTMNLVGSNHVENADGSNGFQMPLGDALQDPVLSSRSEHLLVGYASLRLGFHRQTAAEPPEDPTLARVEHLMTGGGPLTHAVSWLQDVHLRALEQRPGYAALKQDVLRMLNDGLLPEGCVVDDVDADGLWITRDGVRLPVRQVSDGFRAVTNLVLDMIRHVHAFHGDLQLAEKDGHTVCSHPAVVLIDEVDAHLHVSWQRKLGFWLTARFPCIQFLVTTHSPFICQAASSNGLIRLPSSGGTIEHVDEETFQAVVHGTLDEAALSSLFGLESTRSEQAEVKFDELGALELKLIDGSAGEAEIERYEQLKHQLGDHLGAAVRRTMGTLKANNG